MKTQAGTALPPRQDDISGSPEIFLSALRQHQAGHLEEAITRYRVVLAFEPGHADALHLLGLVAHHWGRNELAVGLMGKAILVDSRPAHYHSNRGLALKALKHHGSATISFVAAVCLEPDGGDAYANLGWALQDQGHSTAAATVCSRSVRLRPDHAQALSNLGLAWHTQARLAEAKAAFRVAICLQPDTALTYYNQGKALKDQGHYADAVVSYGATIRIAPDFGDAWSNLGNALRELGRIDDAAFALEYAVSLAPDDAEAYTSLGVALWDCGRPDNALDVFQRATGLAPDSFLAQSNRGAILQDLGQLIDAEDALRRAICFGPDNAGAYSNLGNALYLLGRGDAAVAVYNIALHLKSDFAEAYLNLGNTFRDLGRFEEAVGAYQMAIKFNEDLAEALGQLVHCSRHLCMWTQAGETERTLLDRVREGRGDISPFGILSLESTCAEQQLAARRWAALQSRGASLLPARPAGARDKVRLGYLSADFHAHATAYLMAQLIEMHDRTRFEVTGYSYGPDDASPMRRRLVDGFDHFADIRQLSHRQAAECIHRDGVDILIDLKGYTTGARTRVLAHRPAPIQVNFLGYPGAMGSDFIDYIIGDHVCIPPGHEAFYDEKVVRLPDCYQPNDGLREIAKTVPTRQECGLPDRGFVFCCFNNSYKISDYVFDIWMRLLTDLPDSVLWLFEAGAPVSDNLRREAVRRGVQAERLIFADRRPLPEHLARHRLADLFLDTLPYNAHTTASDALWSGLPVLTSVGRTFAGRVAASLLSALNLPELITLSLNQYQARAMQLASNPHILAAIRSKLQANLSTAPLFDGRRYTRNIETAYLRMLELHRSGRVPESFDVAANIRSRGYA